MNTQTDRPDSDTTSTAPSPNRRRTKRLLAGAALVVGASCLTLPAGGVNAGHEEAQPCSTGDTTAVFNAFYTGLGTVTESILVDGDVEFLVTTAGGVGYGVQECQFRLFAAEPDVVFLPDEYSFCAGDPFLGGSAISFPYTDPDAQQFLDQQYPDVAGYRRKAIAELSQLNFEITLTRHTYIDATGSERPLGDGGADDPVAVDPTAGDPQVQTELVTSFKNSSFGGSDFVYRQHGFVTELDEGMYEVSTVVLFDGHPVSDLEAVDLHIVSCG